VLVARARRQCSADLISRTLLITLYLAFATTLSALEVPPLRGRVNDLARLIPTERARALEERLARFEKETGHQIAVLTIPSIEGEDLESFSIRVAESWKIGQKGFDNGAILLIAKNDRKLRIEVGYGLEGVLPDALASRIIREVIVPRFRSNDFAGGVEAGVDAIIKATRGEVLPKRSDEVGTQPLEEVLYMAFIASIFVLILSKVLASFLGYLLAYSSAIRTQLPAKVLGGTVGVATATASGTFLQTVLGLGLGMSILMWTLVLLTGLLAGAGFAAGAWRNQRWRRDTGWGRGWFAYAGSGGSSSSSGGVSFSGSSSSSGSSFSGGGGSFGGGGASGSW